MPTPKKTSETPSQVAIHEIKMEHLFFQIVGTSPLVPHAVSFKSRGALLYPSGRKNQAEKDSSMKHEPFEEFRDAAYRFGEDTGPTRLYMPAGAFHRAMADAAIDMVGAKKAQIGRLTSVVGDKIAIWGVPQIMSTIVRSSDMARTPDVRTLPILKQWAAKIQINYIASNIKRESLVNLMAGAGVIIGVGDGRPQKGILNYGQFRVASDGDAEFNFLIKTAGLKQQDAALANPQYYDVETEKLLTWFEAEREKRIAQPAKEHKRPGKNGAERQNPITAESVANAGHVGRSRN